ncbi:hypothetical protein VNO80_27552 [Phaseolus coccineus]|uniref:GIR1-like zinc ribbon domain-containing protein n=1 Tax=Phaseolus coccineus TaxID=3886 RepID=A0AAN9QLC8_PHACN
MCKRKKEGSEMRQQSRPTSPEFSSSSSSSSVSYSPKMPWPVEGEEKVHGANAPEAKAMDLVGCPRCFMYVMLSEEDPKCPKCKSTVFLEFFKHENIKTDN